MTQPVRKAPRRKQHEGEFKLTGSALIERPGVYDVPMDKYHGDCCVGHSVSGTDLWTIANKSLAHYWDQSFLNPEREKKTSKALEFGKAAHYLQLGETEFAKHFVVKPWDAFSDDTKRAWRDEHEAAGFSIITKDDLAKVQAMARVLAKDEMAAYAFRDGRPEMSIVWQDADTGIWLKTRPDWLPNTSHLVPNFKTAANGDPDDWDPCGFGYHLKEALRIDGFKAVGRPCVPYFILQETSRPFVCSTVYLPPRDLETGRMLYRKALRDLAKALKDKHFPGYTDPRSKDRKVAMARMRAFDEAKIRARIDNGEFEGLIEGEEKASKG